MCCIVFQVLGKLQCLEVHVSAEGTAGDNRFRLYAQSASIIKVSYYSVHYTPAVLEGIHVYGSHSVGQLLVGHCPYIMLQVCGGSYILICHVFKMKLECKTKHLSPVINTFQRYVPLDFVSKWQTWYYTLVVTKLYLKLTFGALKILLFSC